MYLINFHIVYINNERKALWNDTDLSKLTIYKLGLKELFYKFNSH